MSWNVGLLCVKADEDEFLDIIPDIFSKTEDGLCFEDVTSVLMDDAIGVSYANSWLILVDPKARFITDESYPLLLSKKYKVKSFFISESLLYRDYPHNREISRRFGKAGKLLDIKGLDEGRAYLKKLDIKETDEWGETIIFQIIENEIFGAKSEDYQTSLTRLTFAKFEVA